MDRYFVMHEMEYAVKDQNIMPRIGVYDKWVTHAEPEEEATFTAVTGHCTDKDNLRREGTDWKNVGQVTEKHCLHVCSLDD